MASASASCCSVALGCAATALAQSDERTPVSAPLLPRTSFERIVQESGRKASSQFSATPPGPTLSRQLELVR
ncbi:MAG: hypothetical protein IPO43_22040 [Rhodoferax sp.]|nr:hypothetical protein [Rhodoferax sp.]